MSASNQAAVFRRLRWRLVRNGIASAMVAGRVKVLTMVSTSALVAALVFALSWYGFAELIDRQVPAKGLIVGGLYDLMFFTLGGMLVFSTGVILYASLFTSPESRFLLTTPATADRIFAEKFQSAVALSSWAFLVLGMPILVAYGVVAGLPWYYHALLPVFLLGFVLLPGSASAIVCLLLVRYLPRNRKQALVGIVLLLVVVGVAWGVRITGSLKRSVATAKRNEVEGLIGQFDLVRHPLTPSHWMTEGVMAAARGEPEAALLPLALIWSNGLLLFVLAAWLAKRVYRSAADRATGTARRKKFAGSHPLDRLMAAAVFYLPKPMKVLVVKDFRTFRRDPTQWVLLFIFGGLLLLGASNFRQYYGTDMPVMDRYVVSLVNLAATAVLLCAGLSRFIFPLMSLEGRKFWVLGLVPVRRESIVLGKFAFAATGACVFVGGLTLLGDVLLGMPWEAVAIHLLCVVGLALGLCGLNVGLGAAMPNFRETDPSKIVLGFAGTVNMILGLLLIVLVVGSTCGPLHAAGLARSLPAVAEGELPARVDLPAWAWAGVPVGLLASAVATVVPLRAGVRSLRATEF